MLVSQSLSPCNRLPLLEIFLQLSVSLGPFQGFPFCLAITALDMWPGFWICALRSGRTIKPVGLLTTEAARRWTLCWLWGLESEAGLGKEPGAQRQVFLGRWAPQARLRAVSPAVAPSALCIWGPPGILREVRVLGTRVWRKCPKCGGEGQESFWT